MAREPIFNIDEPQPLRLAGFLIIAHVLVSYIPSIRGFAYQWGLLVPQNMPGADMPRQLTSLFGHGFLHGGWTHLLVNCGMIVAFAVITLRGVRALERIQNKPSKANLKFWGVFMFGVVLGGLVQWLWWGVSNNMNATAVGASGGASALFASAGYAMGGRKQMLGFGAGWALINIVFVAAAPVLGVNMAWAAHMGGFLAGAFIAPYWVKPFSSGASITR